MDVDVKYVHVGEAIDRRPTSLGLASLNLPGELAFPNSTLTAYWRGRQWRLNGLLGSVRF